MRLVRLAPILVLAKVGWEVNGHEETKAGHSRTQERGSGRSRGEVARDGRRRRASRLCRRGGGRGRGLCDAVVVSRNAASASNAYRRRSQLARRGSASGWFQPRGASGTEKEKFLDFRFALFPTYNASRSRSTDSRRGGSTRWRACLDLREDLANPKTKDQGSTRERKRERERERERGRGRVK